MGQVFQLIEQYNLLMQEIEELGGEITPELAEQLNINEQELATKVRAYYYVIKTKEAEIQLAKDEQERLSNVRKSKEGLIKRLKKTVDLAVETFGILKPKAVGKSLDLGDLKVWQKKTVALDINGEIDDERFCKKQFTFTIDYNRVPFILDALEHLDISPNITVDLNKEPLKDWLLENEEYLKQLRKEASEITNVEFEEDGLAPVPTEEEFQKYKDTKIALATQLNYNSTVVFK